MGSDRSKDPVWAVADVRREVSCCYDCELRLLWADESYFYIYGADLIGTCFLDFLSPTDRDAMRAAIATITPDNPRITIRHRSIAADGRVKWEEWTDQGVFDQEGNLLEYHAVGRDVTIEVADQERRLAAESRLRRAIAATGLGTWEHIIATRQDQFDSRALQILGYPSGMASEDVPIWTDRVHPDDLDRVVGQWGKAAAGEAHWDSEYRVRGEDGNWIWVHSAAIDHGGEKIVGVLSDITDRKRAEERLRESERRLHFALEAADEGLWDLDVRSGAMELSTRSADLLGLTSMLPFDGWIGMVHEDDREAVDEVMSALMNGLESQYSIEHRIRNARGETVWVHNRASALERDASGRAIRLVGLLGDVTDRRRTMLEFEYLAHHDPLTGLMNRTAFWEAVRTVLDDSQPAALVLVDLDEFKPVNDDYGHDVGDRLLMEVAARLRHVVRRSDTVARLGGDEFALLCPNFRDGQDERIVKRILAALSDPFTIEEHVVTISGSAGIAIAKAGDQTDHLYARADAALYAAKRAGRNRYVVDGSSG